MILIRIVAALIYAALLGVSAASFAQSTQAPVKIGMSMSQTGALGGGGQAALVAAHVGGRRQRQGWPSGPQGRFHRL